MSPSTLSEIGEQEKRAVAIEGYLLGVKLEGPESPNCHSTDPAEKDFHLWLASSPDDEKSNSAVVEVTPRVRAKHAAWSIKNLRRFLTSKTKVRISGWLMLDPEHPDQVGKTRDTLWEIHPITKIEIWSSGSWKEL